MLTELRDVLEEIDRLNEAINRAYRSDKMKTANRNYEDAQYHLEIVRSIFKQRLSKAEAAKIRDWGMW